MSYLKSFHRSLCLLWIQKAALSLYFSSLLDHKVSPAPSLHNNRIIHIASYSHCKNFDKDKVSIVFWFGYLFNENIQNLTLILQGLETLKLKSHRIKYWKLMNFLWLKGYTMHYLLEVLLHQEIIKIFQSFTIECINSFQNLRKFSTTFLCPLYYCLSSSMVLYDKVFKSLST